MESAVSNTLTIIAFAVGSGSAVCWMLLRLAESRAGRRLSGASRGGDTYADSVVWNFAEGSGSGDGLGCSSGSDGGGCEAGGSDAGGGDGGGGAD
jgi:hypothetical protein